VKITHIEHIYGPTGDFRGSTASLFDVFAVLNRTSNGHMQAVMNHLKSIIFDDLAAKKSGILD